MIKEKRSVFQEQTVLGIARKKKFVWLYV